MTSINTSSVTAGTFTVGHFDFASTYLYTLDGSPYNSVADIAADLEVNTQPGFFVPEQNGGGTANYLWDWQSSTDGYGTNIDDLNPGAPSGTGQIVDTGSATNFFSLTVQLVSDASGSFPAYIYLAGAPVSPYVYPAIGSDHAVGTDDVAGAMDETAITFTGHGATALADIFHNLEIYIPDYAIFNTFNVVFTLTDMGPANAGPSGSTAVWSQHFSICYVSGTRIAVPGGETDIAALAIGDQVMTATGTPRAIRWIGRNDYTAAMIAANPHLQPVTIRQDAIAPGMPHRDLSVSAMHSLYIDDVFVPAAALVNGVSIIRGEDLAPVSYLHIELTEHDVVFAEGLPAETYVNDGNRAKFDNADEFYEMFGADAGVTAFSAPRIEEGVQLEAIRRRIAARAGLTVTTGTGELIGNVERIEDGILLGWIADQTSTTAVELDIFADGELIGRAVANRYRTDLDYHGINGGRAGFSMALPASVTSLDQVSIRRTGDAARIGGRVDAVTV
jgi:hypothetical protein